MGLKSLVLCSDEKVVRVLRRVLSDLEIAVQHCENAETAIRIITRQRFEAVIVDCDHATSATEVLKSIRSAPCNKRAVAVAIINGQTGLRSAFEMGAHFVLYKPVSMERAKVSFRAAHSLMKRERRRNLRIPVQIPIAINGQPTTTFDLSEGGMAIRGARSSLRDGAFRLSFTLPDSSAMIETKGEIAWEGTNGQTGIRFVELSADAKQQLKAWLNRNVPESEKEDPPIHCRLTDLSSGGCYVEINTPFPAGARVGLSMRVAEVAVRAEGVVRVMHPDIGMGIEFTQRTAEQRGQVEKFIRELMAAQDALPDLLVEPEELETEVTQNSAAACADELEDPLLELFRNRAALPADAFLGELRKQRRNQSLPAAESVLGA
jgi:CheY-like chemotaxis protein